MAERGVRRENLGWRQARVGVLLLLGLAVLAYGTFRVGEIFDVFADRYPLYTLLPSAAGLTEGSPVHLAGQRVGQIERIDFIPPGVPAGGNHLVLRLSVAEEVQPQIRRDSRAVVRTYGLLGDKFVDITPGSPRASVLEPGDTLPGVPATDFDEILAEADVVLERANLVLAELYQAANALNRGEGTLGQLLYDETLYERAVAAAAELDTLLAEVGDPDGTIGRLIHDPALYERLTGAVTRVDSIAALILQGEGTLGRLVREDTLYQGLLGVVGQAGGVLTRADTAVAGIADLVEGLRTGDGTLQRLLTDPALYDEFLKAVVDLQTLIADIRQNPRRYRPEVNVDIF